MFSLRLIRVIGFVTYILVGDTLANDGGQLSLKVLSQNLGTLGQKSIEAKD